MGWVLVAGLFLALSACTSERAVDSSNPLIAYRLEVFTDSSASLTRDEIDGQRFQPLPPAYKHAAEYPVWVRARIQNRSDQQELITISFEMLSYVTLYLPTDGPQVRALQAGFLRPRSQIRSEDGPGQYNFRIQKGESMQVLLRIDDRTHLTNHLRLRIQPTQEFQAEMARLNGFTLFFIGAFWSLFIYILFATLTNRTQAAYLWVTVYAIGLGLYSLSIRGYFIQLFFPESPELGWAFNETFYHLATVGGYLFALHFWKIKTLSRTFYRFMRALIVFVVCKGIFSFVYIYLTSDNVTLLTLNIITFPIETIVPGLLLLPFWKSYSPNQRFVLWAVFLVSTLSVFRVVFYLLSLETELTTLGFLADIGGIVSILIFANGLVAESKRTLRQRNAALSEINELQRAQNVKLEKVVQQRTREVSAANETLRIRNQALKERNAQIKTLISEIHHRVTNNFQLVTSLLGLQSRNVQDDGMLDVLNESQTRIRSMSLIHQKLYEKSEMEEIVFADYAQDLFREISAVYQRKKPVQLTLDAPDFAFNIDTAVPLGLILNELLTNAYKYGFASDDPQLKISLHVNEAEKFVLKVQDNGPGIKEEIDPTRSSSYGLRLVRRLARQLRGSMHYARENGAAFTVIFMATDQVDPLPGSGK